MRRIQIRREVRSIIRSDDYPKDDIDRAINRVIQQVNVLGRFRFHSTFTDLTMVTDDYDYAVASTMLAEELLVFNPPTSTKPATLPTPNFVRKIPTLQDAINEGRFLSSGDVPNFYVRFGDEFWFDPIPNATTNGSVVRVYHDADLPVLTSDMDQPVSRFNERYHRTILAVGAALEIDPLLQVNSAGGNTHLSNIYQRSLRNMQEQELWEPLTSHSLIRDARWTNAHIWGNVGTVV